MVVQHNMQAMNANRMLNTTASAQAKSTEKLSSGYKINRAADDAAGLSISEKMRKQIRGLDRASANAQDGISCVQTAEGALGEVQDMLQRMNELAVQSANGTNSETDRQSIQDEIDQLTTEIDRVSETTKFNETYLLKGDGKLQNGTAEKKADISGVKDAVTLAANQKVDAGDYAIGTVKIKEIAEVNTVNAVTAASVKDPSDEFVKLMNQSTDGGVTFKLTTADNTGATNKEKLENSVWTAYQADGTTSLNQNFTTAQLRDLGINLTTADEAPAANGTIAFVKELDRTAEQKQDLAAQGITAAGTGSFTAAKLANNNVGDDVLATVKKGADGKATISAYDPQATPDALKLSLQVGADSTNNNKIAVEIKTMSAKGLGLRNDDGTAIKVNGKDSKNADDAINTISKALQKVSDQRSSLGAVQNRLEHTINNLDNVVENTTSAESQIRDTDMAKEMVKYSKNNILAQAGQSMLAQANQSNQGVLSLLG